MENKLNKINIEDLILLGNFLGIEYDDSNDFTSNENKKGIFYFLRFKSDWNELMKVVDKIELMENQQYEVRMGKDTSVIFDLDADEKYQILFASTLAGEKITATLDVVIQFVKWYLKKDK